MSKILVVGGGPSGIMSAITAAKNGHEVVLLERNGELGRKLKATGGGRCNFTNYREIEDFFDKIVTNKKFLYSSFYTFTNRDLISFFEENSLEYKVEEENDFKVYTKNDKSVELIDTLNKILINNKVKIMYNKKVEDFIVENNEENSKVTGVLLDSGEKIYSDKVIVSTGGMSYTHTGSDGFMYSVLAKYGHDIKKIYPALVPLKIKDQWIKNLQGVSMKNVDVMWKVKKKKFHKAGDMLFTHFGITGPCILKVSSNINKILEDNEVELTIDFLPEISGEEIINVIRKQPSRNIVNNLKEILPQNFSKEIIIKLNLSDKKASEMTKSEEQMIIEEIKNMKLVCEGTTGLNTAMVTSGGVSVKDIDSSTMKSKKIDNLYITGELIDIDAETGGYNLQIAFSTGYLAGLSV
jgi:predicted Rossmann fold flavoprotein